MLNVLDLFCGCGGLSKGLIDAELNVIAGIDILKECIDSCSKNFDHICLNQDLTKFSPEEFNKQCDKSIDIIVGGIPCQGFSMAGNRSEDDSRNVLFLEYVKYVEYYKPKLFMIENVIGILSMKINNKKVIDTILQSFTNYDMQVYKLYANDYEVPQKRRRVIIIGTLKELKIKHFEPIKIDKDMSIANVLQNRDDVDNKLFLSKKAIDGIKRRQETNKKLGKGFGAQYVQLDKPCYTISARYWKDGYDALVKYGEENIRRLNITELKRIQTFPEEYIICGNNQQIIQQIGNAVPCNFAKHLGLHIRKLLND